MEDTERRLLESLGVPARIEQIQIGQYLINYLTAGTGEPVVLVHGGNIGWGQWYPNIAALAKHYTVYALDLPGAGRSSRIDYDRLDLQRDFVEVVRSFIANLHLGSVSIIGSSVGGWIALQLVLSDLPVKKLILVDSLGFGDSMSFSDRLIGIRPFAKLIARTILRPVRGNKNIEKFLRDVFYKKETVIAPQFIDYFYETMATSHNLLLISGLSSFWGVRPELVLRDALAGVKNRTLVVWGERDALMPLSINQPNFSRLPNAQVHIMKDAGHIPSMEKPEEFNRVVIEFLSGTSVI